MPWGINSTIGAMLKYEPPKDDQNPHLIEALLAMIRVFGVEGASQEEKDAAFDMAFDALGNAGVKVETNSMAARFGLKNYMPPITGLNTPPREGDSSEADENMDSLLAAVEKNLTEGYLERVDLQPWSSTTGTMVRWVAKDSGGRAETLKDATASDTPPLQADGPDDEAVAPLGWSKHMNMSDPDILVGNLERLMMWCRRKDPNATIWLHLDEAIRFIRTAK